jgi:hypothetical protein
VYCGDEAKETILAIANDETGEATRALALRQNTVPE